MTTVLVARTFQPFGRAEELLLANAAELADVVLAIVQDSGKQASETLKLVSQHAPHARMSTETETLELIRQLRPDVVVLPDEESLVGLRQLLTEQGLPTPLLVDPLDMG